MSINTCPKKDDPQAVATGRVKTAEFKDLQAACPGGRGKSKRGKRKSDKERMEKKIAAAVLKAQEEAADTAAAATTTAAAGVAQAATTVGTLPNACIPPVPQVVLYPPGGHAPAFDAAASVGGSTLASPGMQRYGPLQACHDGRYTPHPSGYAVLVNQGRYHPYANECGRGGPHNLGFVVMVLLQDATGHNKLILPAEIQRKLPHGIFTVGRCDSPPSETHINLDELADTGAM